VSTAPDAIVLEGVTKYFRLRGAGTTFKSMVIDGLRRRRPAPFTALKDVHFRVKKGETLGIIGANGAGKSTLLSLVAGTLYPNRGHLRTEGAISSLLELGAGFHPELTGRENVYLYGAIMGLSRRRMQERFDDIVAFAGIEPFIDQPVKHYSSGMYVRLGFAVAVEVDPDILLIDEVLAVGDESFQRKCLAKMAEFRERGKTMLIISHDLHTIRSVADRILFLDQGEVKGLGEPDGMVQQYKNTVSERQTTGLRREWGTGEVVLSDLELQRPDGTPLTGPVAANEGLRLSLRYAARERIVKPVFGFALSDINGHVLHGSNTQLAGLDVGTLEGQGTLRLDLPRLPLGGGVYLISVSVHSWDHKEHYHRLDHAVRFSVRNPREFEGAVDIESRWQLSAVPR